MFQRPAAAPVPPPAPSAASARFADPTLHRCRGPRLTRLRRTRRLRSPRASCRTWRGCSSAGPSRIEVRHHRAACVHPGAPAAVLPSLEQVSAPPLSIPPGFSGAGVRRPALGEEEKARRGEGFARLLVSEIKLYNEAKVEQGRKNRDLYERLKEDIDRAARCTRNGSRRTSGRCRTTLRGARPILADATRTPSDCNP
jgi:hypothetical protein